MRTTLVRASPHSFIPKRPPYSQQSTSSRRHSPTRSPSSVRKADSRPRFSTTPARRGTLQGDSSSLLLFLGCCEKTQNCKENKFSNFAHQTHRRCLPYKISRPAPDTAVHSALLSRRADSSAGHCPITRVSSCHGVVATSRAGHDDHREELKTKSCSLTKRTSRGDDYYTYILYNMSSHDICSL